MNNPLITIVVPVYEDAPLEKALKSIAVQNFSDYECLVIDDGSSEANSEKHRNLVASFDARFKFYRLNVNKGAGQARACGIKNSKGKIITFLDSDDYWDPVYLDIIFLAHVEYPEKSIVSTLYQVDKKINFTYNNNDNYYSSFRAKFRSVPVYKVIWRPSLSTPCTSIKRSRILQNFHNSLRRSEDYYFFMKNILLNSDTSIIFIDIPLVHLSSVPGKGSGLSSNAYQMYKSHAIVNFHLAFTILTEPTQYSNSSRILIFTLLIMRIFYSLIRSLKYLLLPIRNRL